MCRLRMHAWDEETRVAATRRAFMAAAPDQRMDSDSDEDGVSDAEERAEEFEEVTEEDQKVMSMFMASDAAPQRTLADIVTEQINDEGGHAMATAEVEGYLTAVAKALEDEPLVVSVLDGQAIKTLLEDEDEFAMVAENLFEELDKGESCKLMLGLH